MNKFIYYPMKLISILARMVAAIGAFGFVVYPCYLVYRYFTDYTFWSPLSLNEYAGFATVTVAGMVAYIISEAVALNYNGEGEDFQGIE